MKTSVIESETIKKTLRARNIYLSDIAEACGCTPSSVGAVINRKWQSKKIATAISLSLGLKIYQVFGDVESYFSPKKRGPKDRSMRTTQVVNAIRNNEPVPEDLKFALYR